MELNIKLSSIQSEHFDSRKNYTVLTLPNIGKALLPKSYRPFEGHLNQLGHYYRHLFQTVKFVVSQDNLTKSNKLEYLRTLRAQLSDHEQVMLYYNAIVGFGSAWINDTKNNNTNYFTEYHMIHNIPIPLANFGVKPEIIFKEELENDPTLFDWLE